MLALRLLARGRAFSSIRQQRHAPHRAFCGAPATSTNVTSTASTSPSVHPTSTPAASVPSAPSSAPSPGFATVDEPPAAATATAAAAAAAAAGENASVSPNGLTTDGVLEMSANRATRYVYLRTLPLAKQEEIAGDDDIASLVSAIEAGTRTVVARHLWRVVDERAAVHLHTTALAIATQRTLTGRLRPQAPQPPPPSSDDGSTSSAASHSEYTGEERVENVIRAAFGAKLTHDPGLTDEENELNRVSGEEKLRPDYWIVRTALWFARDKMGAVAKMTENMVSDFGAAFDTKTENTQTEGVQKHTVSVRRCFYNDVCRAEGLPRLTRVFCALDRAIYSPLNETRHGIEFRLDRTLADDRGDDNRNSDVKADAADERQCEFEFRRVEQK